jgi:chromosomal replication initiation ATPase DnaA
MNKQEIIEIFNASIHSKSMHIDKIIQLISEFLSDIKYNRADEMLRLFLTNPQLTQITIPTIIKHFSIKYNIYSLLDKEYNTILYYE